MTPPVLLRRVEVMPGRNIPLVTEQTYHIVNRGVASQPIFTHAHDYQRALDTLFFYQNIHPPFRYSYFKRLPPKERNRILDSLKREKEFLVDILAYCFMPNHIHLLLVQRQERGISLFMSQVANSYTKYFNTMKKRTGPIFQGKFKAVRIETDEQLLHVSRYIHLNPYTSYVVKKLDQLERYPYSSFAEFLGLSSTNSCDKTTILANFSSKASYKSFVYNQADYQRELEKIKHLTLEN